MDTPVGLPLRLATWFVTWSLLLGVALPAATEAPSFSPVPVVVVANSWYAGPVATVADLETPPGELVVAIVKAPAGVSVSDVRNTGGTVSATIGANCRAASGVLEVGVANGAGEVTSGVIPVSVSPPSPPEMGAYLNVSTVPGGNVSVTPSSPPTPSTQSLSVFVASTFTGTITVDRTGAVRLANAGPVGTHLVTVTLRGACATTVTRAFEVVVARMR